MIAEPPQPLGIATPNLPNAQVGSGYSASIGLLGGTAPYSWTLTGDELPLGLSFEAGVFSGTPLASGSSSFTIQVTDGAMGTATASATLTVDAAPPVPLPVPIVINTTSLPWVDVGTPVSATLSASGGSGSGYEWAVDATTLPPGVNFDDGVFSGTPSTSGTFEADLFVTDSLGNTARQRVTLLAGDVVTVDRRTSSASGGFSLGSPDVAEHTTTEWVWENQGVPFGNVDDPDLTEFEAIIHTGSAYTKHVEVSKVSHEELVNQFGDEYVTLWDWKVQKMVYVQRTFIVPAKEGTPDGATDYGVSNERHVGGTQVLETAEQILASNDRRYNSAPPVMESLALDRLEETAREERTLKAGETWVKSSATGDRYPRADWKQIWLRASKDQTAEVTRSWVARSCTRTFSNGQTVESDVQYGVVSLTIKPGSKVSTTGTLSGAARYVSLTDDEHPLPNGVITCNPPVSPTDGVTYAVDLSQVEVIQPKLKSIKANGGLSTIGENVEKDANDNDVMERVSSIRFCRWADAFSGSFTEVAPQFFKKDRDRFQVRIPFIIPGVTKIKIRSREVGKTVFSGMYLVQSGDGPTTIKLNQIDGALVSDPVLLVADKDDDVEYNGDGEENVVDDATLQANFESPIEIEFPELDDAKTEFKAAKPVGQVTLNIAYCSMGDTIPPDMRDLINLQVLKAKEVYRQIGVKLVVSSIWPMKLPDDDPNYDFPAYYGFDQLPEGALNPSFSVAETNKLWAYVNWRRTHPSPPEQPQAIPANEIFVAFSDATLQDPDPTGSGRVVNGFVADFMPPAVVSLGNLSRHDHLVLAHEVGHILTRKGHPAINIPFRLMVDGDGSRYDYTQNDSKRLIWQEEDQIKHCPTFYEAAH